MLICLTSQEEGCSLELWNTHKGFLKKNFSRLVKQAKAQLRSEEPQPVAGGNQHATPPPASSAPPAATSTSQALPRRAFLKFITI